MIKRRQGWPKGLVAPALFRSRCQASLAGSRRHSRCSFRRRSRRRAGNRAVDLGTAEPKRCYNMQAEEMATVWPEGGARPAALLQQPDDLQGNPRLLCRGTSSSNPSPSSKESANHRFPRARQIDRRSDEASKPKPYLRAVLQVRIHLPPAESPVNSAPAGEKDE